jgi:ABC-type glycerol-3-phosphate transport system substrate-binding protein
MSRQFLKWIVFVLILSAVLAGCAPAAPAEEPAAEEPAAEEPAAPEEISGTVRFYKGPFGPNEAEQYAELIAKFNEEFPNIEVIHEMYDWPTQEAQITAALAGGTHDVIYVAEGYYPKFAFAGGPLHDLSTFVEEESFQEQRENILYWDIAESPDGVLGGVPYIWITESLFMVNDDLLEQAGVPDDWNESLEGVHEAAAAIDALGDDIHGIAWRSPAGEEGAQYDWYGYILRSGADYLNEDMTGCGLDTPEMVETFNTLKAMQDEGLTPEYGAYGWDGLRGLFQGGKLGIMHDEQPFAGVLAGSDPGFNYHFENIPGLANNNMLTFRGFLVIPENSPNQQAAWEWIKFLARPENEVWYLNNTNGLYPALADLEGEELFPNNPVLTDAVSMAQYAQGPLFHPQALEFEHIVQPHIDEFFSGDITAEELISQSCEQIEATLQQ